MKIACPSCNYEQDYSLLEFLKLLKDPSCSKCGANLFEKKEKEEPGSAETDDFGIDDFGIDDFEMLEEVPEDAQLVECPRCRERQPPAELCKWCAAPLTPKKGLRDRLKILGRTGPPPIGKRPRSAKAVIFKILAGLVFVYAIFVVGAYHALKDTDAFRTSKDFIERSHTVRNSVGAKIEEGPYPLIFSYKSLGPNSSFYFYVGGDKGSGVVYLRLRKARNGWQVRSGKLWDQSLNSYPLTHEAQAMRPQARTLPKKRYSGKETEVQQLIREGQRAYNKRDFDGAIARYTRAAQLDPNNPDPYYRRGMAYSRLRKRDEAIADLKKAISLNPDQANYYYYLSWLYMGNKQHDQGIVLLTELIERKPREARAYYYRSRAFHHKREYDEALADINRAIELDPGSSSFYHWRAVTHNQMNQPDKAEKDCLNAIALKAKYPSPYFLLSAMYEKQNKPERSAAILTKLIQVGSGEKKAYYLGQAYFRRGKVLQKQGHGSAALKDFEAGCKHGHKGSCREAARLKKGV